MTKKLDEIDWMKLLKVDPIRFKAWFNLVEEKSVNELTVKFYSLKFNKDDARL